MADWFIMFVVGALFLIWVYKRFYVWLHEPVTNRLILLDNGEEPDGADRHVQLLEEAGYSVTSARHRIPIGVGLDGEMLSSRLYIDYVAEKRGELFLVKTARERMPMDWTGSGVRDRLLVYSLLVPHSAGILYVDAKNNQIRTITFHVNE
ncbi:hypothetical protein PA598K_00931 [Paenibacillus sp. 598K]|uniref:hypothetical protein n=1 Tax=Paenibacillus sp. 598K TaxID=1117987 RepID=UPI000FFA42A9|nr:hypothetical protein [Paenibacillus sp. 598K]GBF72668.1 hypothetical protein PA598K_00931 [Paenibacillus sp. 598K]